VLGLAERALDSRRGDVDRVLAQMLAQDVGDAGAERVVDAGRVVDEDREAVRPGELDREHLDARQGRLDLPLDLLRQRPLLVVCRAQTWPPQQKWALRAHFVQQVKMVIEV
jgi:hypothetical protein